MALTPASSASPGRFVRPWRALAALPLVALLSGCDWVVLNPSGDIARQEAHLVGVATALMLLIIVPVMLLTVLFAWRYRATNQAATYAPDWHHSVKLELVIWSAPLAIIIALGSLTWVSTHMLDPYRPLKRLSPETPVAATDKPLEVDVVALDWKWLFIYPEQGVATVNELVLPTQRQIRFRITSSTVMNSFYVPALAGQIYAMPAMETKLHAVLDKPGNYTGFSAQYSGAGFSRMRFVTRGLPGDQFAAWAETTRKAGPALTREEYLRLDQPSENEPVRRYASVMPELFRAVTNLCVQPGKMCNSDMMALDARGGIGRAGQTNLARLTYDKFGRAQVAPILPREQGPLVRAFVKASCAPGANAPNSVVLAQPQRGGPVAPPLLARPPVSPLS